MKEKLAKYGFSTENNQVFLRRILYKSGKSKAFINDNPVTVGLLQNIGSALIEIHGQNEKIGLLDVGLHVKLLDQVRKSFCFIKKIRRCI